MNHRIDSRRILFWGISLLALLAACSQPAVAQIDRGAIVGRVLDSSGAIVPNATISIINKATGVTQTTKVNDSGEYQVLTLIPGMYVVKATADGFQTSVEDNIEVHVQDRLPVNFTMKVGSVTQQVLVTEAEPLLQTQTADVGGVVN